MTNAMPMLTDDKRQWLIDECTADMQRYTSSSSRYLVAQIALAALTAEPAGHFIKKRFMHSHPSFEGSPDAFMLYTAPPVPALKLPDESDLDPGALVEPDRRVAFMNGARFAIGEVKRMNGVAE